MVTQSSAAAGDPAADRIRAVVASIPAGQVMTYGEVANEAGVRSARIVGRVLAEDGADLPWHRVLRSDGTCAPQIERVQLARLRAEGVAVVGRRVRLSRRSSTAGEL